jgi:PH and SEC7 domain-containing protein
LFSPLSRHNSPPPNFNIPSIGFASNLTQTIIREQREDDAISEGGKSLTEEELALLGAPWAKEGILQRKHYWESTGKRSKDKHWVQCFVVISKGEMRMFKFLESGGGGRGAVGGGNWLVSCHTGCLTGYGV